MLSYLRCVAKVWETHDSQGSDYAYTISQREVPRRAATCLTNLARGHALLTGRNWITLDDIPIIIKTALDTAQTERVVMFSLLLAHGGTLTTNQILQSLNIARKTALRTMAELKAIDLVEMEDYHEPGQNNISKKIILNPRFNWFLSDSMITKVSPYTTPNISKVIEGSTRTTEKIVEGMGEFFGNHGNGNGSEDTSTEQIADPLHVSKASRPTLTKDSNNVSYRCYHNGCNFHTDNEEDYRTHGATKHVKNPLLYPSKAELEKYCLQPQGKEWEK